MIKVIASDMDGTLLGDNHKVAPETVEAIREAQAAGIRFMIATGRSYNGAMEELKGLDLGCDFIVGSGAEIRNPKGEILKSIGLHMRSAMRWQRYWKNIQSRYCIAPDLMSIVWEHRRK